MHVPKHWACLLIQNNTATLNFMKEWNVNNMHNDNAGFLFLTKRPQEEHSCSMRRLRSFGQEQKDKSIYTSYLISINYTHCAWVLILNNVELKVKTRINTLSF